jgi:GntR family transcriptional regulator
MHQTGSPLATNGIIQHPPSQRSRAAIKAGAYEPGTKLPSYDALAEQYGVSLGVVKRAMTQLRDERIIVIRHGQGSYVRSGRDAGQESGTPMTNAELQAELSRMAERLDKVERRLAEPWPASSDAFPGT